MYAEGDMTTEMRMSERGRKLVESFEGLRLEAYLDQRGIPTIGYGHTSGVKLGDTCTAAQADRWMDEDLAIAESVVSQRVLVDLNQNEFDALVSFAFNIGGRAFRTSTMLRVLNYDNHEAAAREFPRWDKVDGATNDGLVHRRDKERQMFLEAV